MKLFFMFYDFKLTFFLGYNFCISTWSFIHTTRIEAAGYPESICGIRLKWTFNGITCSLKCTEGQVRRWKSLQG